MLLAQWSRRLMLTATLSGILACSDSDDRCTEGGEFANDGCAQIAGFIQTPSGEPIEGVLVSVLPRDEDPAAYTFPSATTGETGRFVLNLFRLATEIPPQPEVSMRLRMTIGREPPLIGEQLIEVKFVPVGELTPTTEVEAVFDTVAASSARVGA